MLSLDDDTDFRSRSGRMGNRDACAVSGRKFSAPVKTAILFVKSKKIEGNNPRLAPPPPGAEMMYAVVLDNHNCTHSLFTNIVKSALRKRDSQQATTHVDHLRLELVDDMHLIRDANPLLDRAQELVKEAIDKHANYNTARA